MNRPTKINQLPVDVTKTSSPPGWSSINGVISYTCQSGMHTSITKLMEILQAKVLNTNCER